MLARFSMLWVKVRDSLWFLPAVLTLLATLLALAAIGMERRGGLFSESPEYYWIFEGGAEGARGVLTAIAGGLITVTGVVFSVTIVALQLASSQFTPRLLRDFTADRGNQLVLGVFIATFTYTLLVLRTVHSGLGEEPAFVPRIGVTVAVVLVLISIAFLIFFINHSARSIQAAAILDRVAKRTLADVDRRFPEPVGRADQIHAPDPRRPERPSAAVRASRSGYLQAVDAAALFQIGRQHDVVIGMEPRIGEFVLEGQVLARTWPPLRGGNGEVESIREAFVLGTERTPEQDVEFGIIEISDIAVKALSPGINDPTTALRGIDRLGEILRRLGTRNPPAAERTEEGRVHFIARYTGFERAVALSFDQIRHYGASNPAVAIQLLSTLERLAELLPSERAQPLLGQARSVLRDARSGIGNPSDLEMVERAADRLLGTCSLASPSKP